MNKRKISVDILSSPRLGGPLRWSRELARWIDRQPGFQTRVLTDLPRLLLSHVYSSADIVHASIPLTLHPVQCQYVLTVKGDYSIEKNFWRALYPRAVKIADVVTVPSQYLKDRIPALARAHVIPNAVNLEEFTPVQLHDREELQLTIVSNFWFPEKIRGVIHLLDLLTQVRMEKSLSQFSLNIVGDGGYLATVQKTAAQAPFKVTFHGWIDPRTVFSDTDVFLYYSYHDNMPNALLEAMAVGLPVLTNQVGAVSEMMENRLSGIIASSDEEYISETKRILSSFSLRRELGQNSRSRIEQRFSWQQVVRRFIDIYSRP